MPRRRPEPSPSPEESPEDRWLRDEQTARNLAGLEAERAGRVDDAIALYERNAAEGFAGDWPYGRLVAIYEKRGALEDAERVLRRGIEVFGASKLRTPQDRATMIRTFRKRLMLVTKRRRADRGGDG
jgi:hypothetical protein